MPIGDIDPPSVGIQDEPTVSLCINRDWAAQLLAMVYPAQYPEWWSGTLEENRYARTQVRELLYILSTMEECGDMTTCCQPAYVIQRINPDTHMIEISTNNGSTWQPQPGSLPTYIVEPPPPVTSGTAGTKCDAAKNWMENFQAWVTHVTNDFDTATSLLSFASAVLEAILVAVVTILSLGTLTAVEAAVLPIIGAACAAVFTAGKTAFVDYWAGDDTDRLEEAIYCTIGDDGAFTDEQFTAAWNKINTTLTGNPSKNLLLGMLTSIGRQGMNNMAAQGTNAGSDCSAIDCSDCACSENWFVRFGTPVSHIDCTITGTSAMDGDDNAISFGWGEDHAPCTVVDWTWSRPGTPTGAVQWYLADGSGPFMGSVPPFGTPISDIEFFVNADPDTTPYTFAFTFAN